MGLSRFIGNALFYYGAVVPFATWSYRDTSTVQVGNKITFAATGGSSQSIESAYTEAPIDLTNISQIRFKHTWTKVYDSSPGYMGRFAVCKNPFTSTNNTAYSPYCLVTKTARSGGADIAAGEEAVSVIDVSELTGEYHVGCWGAWVGEITEITYE